MYSKYYQVDHNTCEVREVITNTPMNSDALLMCLSLMNENAASTGVTFFARSIDNDEV